MDAGSAAGNSANAPCEAHYAAAAGSAAAQPTLVGSAQPLKLRGVMRRSTSLAAIGLAVSAVLSSGSARAADRALDQLSTEAGSVVIQFGCPMSFVSNYPLRTGDELRIELQPLPGCGPISGLGESLPVPADNPSGLLDIRLEPSLGSRR